MGNGLTTTIVAITATGASWTVYREKPPSGEPHAAPKWEALKIVTLRLEEFESWLRQNRLASGPDQGFGTLVLKELFSSRDGSVGCGSKPY